MKTSQNLLGQALVLEPATDNDNILQPLIDATTPLIIRRHSPTQTGALLRFQTELGVDLSTVDASGAFTGAASLPSGAVILAPAASARNIIQATADIVPLTIQAKAGQTADLTDWKDSAGNILFKVQPDPTTLAMVYATRISGNVGGSHNDSLRGEILAAPATTPAASTSWRGVQALAKTDSSLSTDLSGSNVTLMSLNAATEHLANVNLAVARGAVASIAHFGTGTIALATPLHATISSSAGGVITNGTGLLVSAPGLTGGSTIGTNAGIEIQNQGSASVGTAYGLRVRAQAGSGLNFGINVDGGLNIFRSSAVGETPFIVRGFAGQTATLLDVQTSAAASIFAVGQNKIGAFGTAPVAQQAGASAAGIAAVIDANAKAALTALQAALAAYGLVTSPA